MSYLFSLDQKPHALSTADLVVISRNYASMATHEKPGATQTALDCLAGRYAVLACEREIEEERARVAKTRG